MQLTIPKNIANNLQELSSKEGVSFSNLIISILREYTTSHQLRDNNEPIKPRETFSKPT